MRSNIAVGAVVLAAAVFATACQDLPTTLAAPDDALAARSAHAPQDVGAWFARSSPEVLALPGTVFADHDESANRLVFGIENAAAMRGVQNALTRLGIPASAYEIQVTEPIHFMSTLRDRHRPTMGGLQIHWGNYLCTLGFSVDHAGGRSMITNSHCTNNQGSTGSTAYYQPLSSVDSNPIAIEAHDPAYFRGGVCPRGRVCRNSDAARALYADGVGSLGRIAKTTGLNTGSVTVDGSFNISGQNNTSQTFSGEIQKVGRTTGWTSGNVTNTCTTVNVSGSNVTLLCQTLVRRSGTQIVAAGDSGSPVFTGSSNVTLVGILWGGSGSGDLFVFSPLKNIQDELGSFNATTDGVGGGGNGGDPSPPDDEDPNCPPGHQRQGRC
jgi:hypothetical protein